MTMKKIDLVNYTIQICQRFYSDLNELSKDFPVDNLSNFYEVYEDKINSIKVELRLNNLLTDNVNSRIDNIVSEIKSGEVKEYQRNLSKLRKDLTRNI